MTNFDSFFTHERLNSYFEAYVISHTDIYTQRVKVCTGADRISYHDFILQRSLHINTISRKALNGSYVFSPLLEHEKPKPESKENRIISVSTIRDTILQKAIYEYLYQYVDNQLNDCAYGYRRSKSAHQAIQRLQQYVREGRIWIYDADLSKFFDEIDHDILIRRVKSLGIDPRAETLVYRFLRSGRVSSDQVEYHKRLFSKQEKYQSIPRKKGVPQGGVLSGLLSNLYLADFDKSIESRFGGMVRYADDFVVCVHDEKSCQDIHNFVVDELMKIDIQINPKKTNQKAHATEGIGFLGFAVYPNKLSIRKKNIARFKKRVLSTIAKVHALTLEYNTLRRSYKRCLQLLCSRLQNKIRGPSSERLIESNCLAIPYQRCWIAYFRIMNDYAQLKRLDKWIRREILRFIWKQYSKRVDRRMIVKSGLTSLYNALWKSRAAFSKKATQLKSD